MCIRKFLIIHNEFRDSAVDYSQYEFAEQSYLLHPTFSHKLLFFLAEDVLQAVLACGAGAKIVFGTFIVPLCQENKNPVIFF